MNEVVTKTNTLISSFTPQCRFVVQNPVVTELDNKIWRSLFHSLENFLQLSWFRMRKMSALNNAEIIWTIVVNVWVWKVQSSPTGHVGPEGSRRVKAPSFRDNGTEMVVGCQPYAPAAFTPGIFLVLIFTRGWVGRKEIYHWKIQWHHRESIPGPSD